MKGFFWFVFIKHVQLANTAGMQNISYPTNYGTNARINCLILFALG